MNKDSIDQLERISNMEREDIQKSLADTFCKSPFQRKEDKLKDDLIQFMKYYKNKVLITTNKSSVQIVEDYFEYLNSCAKID